VHDFTVGTASTHSPRTEPLGPNAQAALSRAVQALDERPDDGTPTNDPAAALHWAAAAYNLAAAREQQGNFLTADEQANFTRYQTAARSHGQTDGDVRAYAATLSSAVQA
jgi:hypothetical protein